VRRHRTAEIRLQRCRALLAPLLVWFAIAPPARGLEQLESALDREVKRHVRAAPNLAVHVVALAQPGPFYGYRPEAAMIPASNQKLLTTAAAVALLGPGYTFETSLGMRGVLGDGGVLLGDLAVRGAGDPTISGRFDGDPYSAFRPWAAALKARGVRTVIGDVYLEHGLFDGPTVHPSWPPEQLMWWYEAPVAALSFADNCQLLRAWGSKQQGRPGVLEVFPRIDVFDLRNRLRTGGSRGKHHWVVNRAPGSRVVDVSGQLNSRSAPLEVWVTVPDPVTYFGGALRDALDQEGISVQGELRPVERLPGPWWELVATHRTLLGAALDVTNKRSQNFYAESLFKLLGARFCGEGTWEAGTRVVNDFLVRRVGWQRDHFRVVDGSGMARGNSVSARQITALLQYMFRQRWGVEYVRSLPFSGEPEASLHRRLTSSPYRGNVFAKTGTISGVSTLSGYVKGRSGRLYAFSVLVNGSGAGNGRTIQDRVVQVVVDNG
jgi:D-alanyl-D-alanine carboxypeptidase/D-alanyl-D-alanine-endopeptidase (penicillin-binding protein 4)